VNSISLERAIELYVRARKLEWKRLSTIQVHWRPACQEKLRLGSRRKGRNSFL